jgi:hypothetical protein
VGSPRIDVVFRLWQCDKENHGWREGAPVTVLCQSFRSAGRAFTLPEKSLRTKKEYCFPLLAARRDRADRPYRAQEADNGPMPDIADLHERATGVRVSKALPCGDDHIVLLDYYQAAQSSVRANLRRVKSTGDVVWAASTPSSCDIFTMVDWRDGRLVAWTWEGFMITVDQETGKPIEVVFTK